MRITADTNVLLRVAVPVLDPTSEDGVQAAQARDMLQAATLIAVTMPTLCEFAWVLRSVYRYSKEEIGRAIETLCASASVTCDRQGLVAGLRALAAGGDFADGVIAAAGASMGADTFVSFDRRAVRILRETGHQGLLLGDPARA